MFAFAVLLAMASPSETVLAEDQIRQMSMMSSSHQAEAAGQLQMLKGKAIDTAIREAMSDQTRAVLIPNLGIYVVYTAADGRLFAWFPGHSKAVGGTWATQKISRKAHASCQGFARTGGPGSGPSQPKECQSAEAAVGGQWVLDRWSGDPFGLGSGDVPFAKQAMGLPKP